MNEFDMPNLEKVDPHCRYDRLCADFDGGPEKPFGRNYRVWVAFTPRSEYLQTVGAPRAGLPVPSDDERFTRDEWFLRLKRFCLESKAISMMFARWGMFQPTHIRPKIRNTSNVRESVLQKNQQIEFQNSGPNSLNYKLARALNTHYKSNPDLFYERSN